MKSSALSAMKLNHQIRQLEQVCQEDKHNHKSLREKLIRSFLNEDSLEVFDRITSMQGLILRQKIQLSEDFYESKKKRYEDLEKSAEDIALEIAIITAYCQDWTPYQQPVGQLGAYLNYDDPFDGVKTAAELIAVCCDADLYDIDKNRKGELILRSNLDIDIDILEYAEQMHYMPPSLVPPRRVYKNHHSGMKSDNGSLILGRGNHHDKPLAYDVINTLSEIPLALDEYVISQPEPAPESLEQTQQLQLHNEFTEQAKKVFKTIIDNGNECYLPWKYDKRGRTYSQGYHINLQATEYRKAMINLYIKERLNPH